MPDSLLFDGLDDKIIFDDGNASHAGASTFICIAKLGDDAGFENMLGLNTPTTDCLVGTDNASPRHLSVFPGSGAAMTSTFTVPSSDGWCVYGYSRPDDAAGKLHKYVYNTTTWTHESNATSTNDIADITDIVLGCAGNISQFFNGNMLIAGWWNSEVSDATIETLTSGLSAWVSATPTEAWRLNTLSAISSFAAGGTANETSRTGTTLDSGDAPTGWTDGDSGLAWIRA